MSLLADEAERIAASTPTRSPSSTSPGPGQALGASGAGALAHLTSDAVPYAPLGDMPAYVWAAVAVDKLLVANRGEIAIQVFRACRDSGSGPSPSLRPTIASLCTQSADETIEIGYLHSEEHIRAAKQAGADTIHPGYGFLAENPAFGGGRSRGSDLRRADGGAAARRGQARAKRIALGAGVPVVPTGEPDELAIR